MTFDRIALTVEAVQYTGAPEPIALFIGAPVKFYYGRHYFTTPNGTEWRFLDRGDWVVRGVGPEWDFYVIADRKFIRLWKPRAH